MNKEILNTECKQKLYNYFLDLSWQPSENVELLNFNVETDTKNLYTTKQSFYYIVFHNDFDCSTVYFGKPYMFLDKENPNNEFNNTYQWCSDSDSDIIIENLYRPMNECWDDELVCAFMQIL